MNPYKTYLFKNKDPVIDLLRTAIQVADMSYKEVSEASGVSVGTLYSWFQGPTKRPQFASVQAVAIAVRKEFRMQDSNVVSMRRRA